MSLYVSLDEVPAEVAVRFVKGSHRWGRLFYPRVFLDGADFNTDDAGLEAVPDIDARPEDYEILAWDLEPGDVIAFDLRTLHGTTAGGNGSSPGMTPWDHPAFVRPSLHAVSVL